VLLVMRRAIWVLVLCLLAGPLLIACGAKPNEPGGLEGQILGLLSPTEQPVLLQGAVVAISGPGGTQTALTDAEGRYGFSDLRPGGYGFAASYEGPQAGDKRLQSEERQFTVSPGQDETISSVLLAEGITPPPSPPPPPQSSGEGQASGGGGMGGLLANPFFWYFLFNQPQAYGYGRPPVVYRPGGQGPITVNPDLPQRSPSGRSYTNYGDSNTTGVRTKPVPPITSRGATRPGVSAPGGSTTTIKPPAPSSPGSNGSRGVTRPGGSNPGTSVRPPTSRPPAIRPPRGRR